MKKVSFILVIVLLSALLLCGCGQKSTEPTAVPMEEPVSEPAVSTAPEIVTGGSITVGVSNDLDQSLDPHVSTSAGKRELFFSVFEGLLKPTTSGEMVPALAESYEISENADSFTFKLRQGVKFHNGKEMTAEDVVYSLNRCRGIDTGQPLIAAFAAITDVSASEDGSTVTIKLNAPNIEFTAYLNAAIIPADYDKQDTEPVGTGPYRFVSRSVQENIIMEKFADYWGEPGYLDKVTFKIIENTDAMALAIRSGTIDLAPHRPVSDIEGMPENMKYIENAYNIVQALYLNNDIKPLNDLKVRQALNYAINKEEIINMVGNGIGEPLGSSMYPAFGKYFIPELTNAYPFDPEKAKSLLAEAGYPNGFDLVITVPSNYVQHVDTAQIVAEQLKAIGVRAKINLVDWAFWLSNVYQARDYEATISGFDASALTARSLLERWMTGNSKNMIFFSNEEYDQVMAEAFSAVDAEHQTELYKRAETILSEQAANVYIQDPGNVTIIRKDLDGYQIYPLFTLNLAALHFVK